MNAAEILRSARAHARLTQRELADRAGIPQPTIAAIETGKQDPRYATLDKLLRICGFDLDLVPHDGEGEDRTVFTLDLTPTERLRFAERGARTLRWLERARPVRARRR
jgi:transcriptional regulator with XRE-family HTH domain